jgi:peroxiredoxin
VDWILIAARLVIAGVFATSGAAKLFDRSVSRQAMVDFGIPSLLAPSFGVLLPIVELVVAVSLVPAALAWWGALGALLLLLAFNIGIGVNLARGRAPNCHCFGQLHSEPVGRQTLVRNALLLVIALYIAVRGFGHPGPTLTAWVTELTVAQRAFVVIGIAAIAFLALLSGLLLRLLQRIERLERRLGDNAGMTSQSNVAPGEEGLAVGTLVPWFELPVLDGETTSVDDLYSSGKPLILFFTDPSCGSCRALVPDIEDWMHNYSDRATFTVISQGSAAAVRRETAGHDLEILLETGYDVGKKYGITAHPAAVMIHPSGVIGSPVALGIDAIQTLVRQVIGLVDLTRTQAETTEVGTAGRIATPLSPGDAAPHITLTDLRGNHVHLTDFLGRDVLVLFWDSSCAFCQELELDLLAWEIDPPVGAPALLIVLLGSLDDGQVVRFRSPFTTDPDSALAQAFGVTGTPMAVLINRAGVVASEVAMGASPILRLLSGASPVSNPVSA